MVGPVSLAILTHFEGLTDPRVDRGKLHNLIDIVGITLCAFLCGAEGWEDVERYGRIKQKWLAKWLELPNGIPSHDTFRRVFNALKPAEFVTCLQSFVANIQQECKGRHIAIDGKTVRRSFDTATNRSALHLVSAWSTDVGVSLGQVAVDSHSNEITAVPSLLALLELEGAVVTLDAMHCQKETAAAIRERDADYVLTVKANQANLHEAVHEAFLAYAEKDFQIPQLRRHTTEERGHGRYEKREYFVAPAPKSLLQSGEWRDLETIGMVIRTRQVADKEPTTEVSYHITSLPPKVKRFACVVRGHWSIENTLHWSLDVTFSEDRSRIRTGKGPENVALLRRLTLSILKQDTSLDESLRGKRLMAGWDNQTLERILCGFRGN